MIRYVELIRPINSGKYGTVYKSFDHKAKRLCATKILPKSRHDIPPNKNKMMIENEIANMMRLNGSPNIVRLHDVLQDSDNYYLVEELCGGSTLQEDMIASRLNLTEKRSALKNITSAIATCHDANIMFCDLKPSNIVYSTEHGVYKLTDFGSSIDINSTQQIPSVTPLYVAPELVKTHHASLPYDIWAIGIIAYQLYYGIISSPMNQTPQLPSSNSNVYINEFIISTLREDPELRPTAKQLLQATLFHQDVTTFKTHAT